MNRYFVFREGAFQWTDQMLSGDIDFTDNDSAEDAQRVVNEYYDRKRQERVREAH